MPVKEICLFYFIWQLYKLVQFRSSSLQVRTFFFFFFFLLLQGIEGWNLVLASLPNGKHSFVAVEMTVLHVSSLHLIWSNYIIYPNVNMWANNIYQFHSLFDCCLLPFIFYYGDTFQNANSRLGLAKIIEFYDFIFFFFHIFNFFYHNGLDFYIIELWYYS